MQGFISFIAFCIFVYMIYCICRWVISFKHKPDKKSYGKRFGISLLIFFVLAAIGGSFKSNNKSPHKSSEDISNRDINKLNKRNNKRNKGYQDKEDKQFKQNQKQQAINAKLKRKRNAELQGKLNKEYPPIQDKLQNMSNNQLFMTQAMVKGKVLSWGAQDDGSGMILIKDKAGNEFTLEPSHRIKGIEDGSTIVAYGGNFDKQKINDSQTNNAISSEYLGDKVINMPSIDNIKLLGSKGDI